MFDLEAGVGLDEVEVVVLVQQELEGSDVAVADGLGGSGGDGGEAVAGGLGYGGGRGFLDDFLVATLDGTFALPEVGGEAVGVADYLDFDVAGVGDESFEIYVFAAEGSAGG